MSPIAVESIGAFTSAGASTAQTMAALFLGVKLFEESGVHDARREPVIVAASALGCEGPEGLERLASLALLALDDCAGGADPAPLLLCAPPAEDAFFDPGDLLRLVLAQTSLAIDGRRSRAFGGGRAGLGAALREAERLLASGACATCLVGGVDSLVDPEQLDGPLRAGRVKTGLTPDGFVPGEGAVFLRLAARPTRQSLAVIAGLAEIDEPAARDLAQANHGAALARAARAALEEARLPMNAVGLLIHDAAGDRRGFREAALAIARLRPRADPPPAIWTPATVAGELRAAYGPLAVAQAAFFLRQQVSAGPAALVLATDPRGPRGAIVVMSPREPGQRARG